MPFDPVNDREQFEAAVTAAIAHIEKVFAKECESPYVPAIVTPARIEKMYGPRYIRLVKVETFGSGRSAYAFISRDTGDILYPKSWAGPAKTARGNIFKPETFGCFGPHGIARLR